MDSIQLGELKGRSLSGEAWTLGDQVLVAGFDVRAQSEFGVWRRLLVDRQVDFVIFQRAWTKVAAEATKAVIAPENHARTICVNDSDGRISSLIGPDRPERSFATVVVSGVGSPVMIGLPTEEGLDFFEAAMDR